MRSQITEFFDSILPSSQTLRVLLKTGVLCTLLSTCLALLFSWYYWGYVLKRPQPIVSAKDVAFVSAYSHIKSEPKSAYNDLNIFDLVKLHDAYPYDIPWGRVASQLYHAGFAEVDYKPVDQQLMTQWERILGRLAFIDKGTPGYEVTSKNFHGSALEYQSVQGNRMLVVSLRGGQVQNDHYVYYELLFPVFGQNTLGDLIAYHKFYYDIAGIEGVEWWVIVPILSIVLWLLCMPFVLFCLNIREYPSFSLQK